MAAPSIDARFHRAVDIIQSLPKGGPVQTSYEEKLWLYSLYKQATEGDISISRPGLLDMLGRSKWDSWNKQKGKGKDAAKQDYIAALLKILKRHTDRPTCAAHITELEGYLPRPTARRHHRPRSTSSGSSSSSSSYHSSQAPSPPPSPPRYSSYPPPDPNMPVPDVAPDIIPPSSLTTSHKSLLNLSQAHSSPSRQMQMQEIGHLPPEAEPGYAQIPVSSSGGLYPIGGAASRAHSLAGGRAMSASVDGRYAPSRKDSVHSHPHSYRQRPLGNPPAALGFLAPGNTGEPGRRYEPSHPSRPTTPSVLQRDFTPALSSTPYLGMGLHHPEPSYPPNPQRRFGTPSTYSAPPINVPATLQQIQTSLNAIHERMNHLERSQAMILRRDERKRTWFWTSRDEEDLDEAEDQAERERLGGAGRTGPGAEVRTGQTVKTRKKWSLRLIWWALGVIRRLAVDLGVGLLVGIAAIMIIRGWRGAAGRRVRARMREMLQAAQ